MKNNFKFILLLSMLALLFISLGCTQENILDSKTKSDENVVVVDSYVKDDYVHDHDHDHFAEIEGKEMKSLTVKQVADLWEIDSDILLQRIIEEFDFKGDYTSNTMLEEMRLEYKFSPAIIKDIAEEIKNE
jgi:hypothetical protein